MPMDINKILQSKFFSGVICGLAIFVVLSLVFAAGMAVGFKKADYSYRFGDNYHEIFAGPGGGGMMRRADGREYVDGHGAVGQVIKIDSGSVVIKDRDNVEKIIVIDEKTQINRFRESIKITDLKLDETLVVIGEPADNGWIAAKLIRVMPPKAGENSLGDSGGPVGTEMSSATNNETNK